MDEENSAEEIIDFMCEHNMLKNFRDDYEKLDLIYGLAQYLGEELPPVEEKETNDEWRRTCSAKEFADFLNNITYDAWLAGRENEMPKIKGIRKWDSWLRRKHI